VQQPNLPFLSLPSSYSVPSSAFCNEQVLTIYQFKTKTIHAISLTTFPEPFYVASEDLVLISQAWILYKKIQNRTQFKEFDLSYTKHFTGV
jgi:hypothetical protein